ncbi:hybrid sensor histidine kinase/response regulator [Sporosarcina sp. FSL K6-3457]|uniref:hybrid sensor histidine kinase/response regulator n=1 Tax=Sporosarcina sp. FSL K6-3457 TaxID=2978204 RepID=UPI0030F61CE9
MSKKKTIVIVVMFACLLLSFRLLWINQNLTVDYPLAEKGILDLRGTELQDDKSITLNGEWLFYREQLVDPQKMDAQQSGLEPFEITVPGDWRKSVSHDENSSYGYGTYRLRILLDEHAKQYTLNFKEIRSSATIFINGEHIASMGQVAETEEASIPDYRPFEVTMDGQLKEIDLMIQVSNYESSRSGGIVKSIIFGTSTATQKDQHLSFMMQFMVATILLLHGIYAFAIFLLFGRKRELIYLSIAFISATVSVLVDDDKLLLYLLPSIDWTIWKKLLHLSYASSAFFMMQFCKPIILRSSIHKKGIDLLFKLLTTFYSLYIVCVLLDVKIIIAPLFSVIMLTIPVLIPLLTLRLVTMVGKPEVIYLLLATTSIASSAIWGSAKSRLYASFPYYPFDIIIGVIFFAIFWFKRFFQVTDESKELTVKLQKEIQQKDDFLANTSHELRNPLHGIMNISQTIYDSEKDHLTEESKKNLQIVMTVGRRMSMILNDLLDIKKLNENRISLQVREVDLTSVVAGVFDTLRFMREGKCITFVQKIPEMFPKVVADENRLFQILFNLVHNAVKYTAEGEIIVSAEVRNGQALIYVQDQGIGMDEETVKHIFQPYERADSEMTAIAGGIGLGLSICMQLVQLHGGSLSVTSIVGKGSTFTFTLPIAERQLALGASRPEAVKNVELVHVKSNSKVYVNKGQPRLLVVDDDPLNLSIVEQILSAEQYDVVTCTSGKEALVLLDKERWDLVISDVMMPHMSGYELTRKIRERFTLSELPILLLTARSQLEDIQTGFMSGANDYVTKPVEKLELITRVRALTDLKASIHERVRMEAAWLQAQIRPHFLFNTLNTIAALSELDTSKVTKMLDEFGNYLQASFTTRNLDPLVSLAKELELVRSYVFIEQQRFGDRLHVEWEIGEMPNVEVPPLTIQTLVENAINHGVLKRRDGGTVRLQLFEWQEYVDISIMDNGVGISEERLKRLLTNETEGQRGIGLLNTDKRLKQQFGRGLAIISKLDEGTTVTFRVPKVE